MKLMDLFCSSNASTAVTSSMQYHRSMAPRRSKSYHYDRRKSQFLPHVPCSSQFPINPKPYFEKHRKSTSAEKHRKSTSSEKHNNSDMRRHSSVELSDLYTHHRHSTDGSSRRYLLGDDAPFIDWVSESDKIPPMNPSQLDATAKHMLVNRERDDSPALRSSSVRSRNQVVVLRVSLHCKACEGKVRKHISKMEGVTSFSIDMETKKVTIIGDVTPLRALASVSEVKSAQLWRYPTPTSTSSSSSSSSSSVLSSSSSSMPQSPWST